MSKADSDWLDGYMTGRRHSGDLPDGAIILKRWDVANWKALAERGLNSGLIEDIERALDETDISPHRQEKP
jgi:hypothetical protein